MALSDGLVVCSLLSHQYSLSSLLPIKMTLISIIYCYVLIAIFFANCETKTVRKDKWMHNTASIRFDDTDVQSSRLRLRREKSLGDACYVDEDCNRNINNSECRHQKCECKTNFYRIKNSDLFLVCNNNNINVNDLQHESTTPGPSYPDNSGSLHMLAIMIVLGLMFVGMCVALNLFSRARFRNERSIFSNPRLIQMAKAQEGRVSQNTRKLQAARGSSEFEVDTS